MNRKASFRNTDRSPRSGRRSRRRNRRSRATNGKRQASASKGSDGGWVRHGTALPTWADLETAENRRLDTSEGSFLEEVSTVRFSFLVLLIAGAFTLYVGHVHATTDLLNRLQEARTQNQRLHLKHNRLKGEFDRQTGPSVIYERAREMGLRASVTHGPPVKVK